MFSLCQTLPLVAHWVLNWPKWVQPELLLQTAVCCLRLQAALREGYLEDTLRLIRRLDLPGLSSLEEAQAAARRLEALATDVLAREPRFSALKDMAKVIVRENYHSKEQVIMR